MFILPILQNNQRCLVMFDVVSIFFVIGFCSVKVIMYVGHLQSSLCSFLWYVIQIISISLICTIILRRLCPVYSNSRATAAPRGVSMCNFLTFFESILWLVSLWGSWFTIVCPRILWKIVLLWSLFWSLLAIQHRISFSFYAYLSVASWFPSANCYMQFLLSYISVLSILGYQLSLWSLWFKLSVWLLV